MATTCRVAVAWSNAPAAGSVEIVNGVFGAMRLASGAGSARGNCFELRPGPARIEVSVTDARLGHGAHATMVRVEAGARSFAFLLRDVRRGTPIFVPAHGVVVTEAGDRRSFVQIVRSIRAKKRLSSLAAIEAAPEETFDDACRNTRDERCPTWLGLSRDMRIFEVGVQPQFGYWGYVQPRYHSVRPGVPETGGKPYSLAFEIGPGISCRSRVTRRLEDGCLPILHSMQVEEGITYHVTAFATLETKPLSLKKLRGSDWKACYPNTGGNMLSKDEIREIAPLIEAEMRGREEETVCWIRIEAANTAAAPHYAWFKAMHVQGEARAAARHDGAGGFTVFDSGRVAAVHLLNGAAAPQAEMAVLVQPGETVVYDILVPHQPLPRDRAVKLAAQKFKAHHAACRRFWKAKLASAARVSVPEQGIDERVKAGLLHCDIAALGREPDGPVLATIGWYSPIGSESAPIIQFFDSMGWHALARRALDFFLERQRADGFIQNFGGYQLETGPALWSIGEHFRYTRDTAWAARIKPKVLKACDYLLAWRERNKRDELRGRGYGLLDGKVADPEDFFHSFMLNGLSYLGVQRAAEMLESVDPAESRRLAAEAAAFREDIRTAFHEAIARSPVIPLDDGTWTPSVPPWAEYPGPVALYAGGGDWFTHGAFGGRDSLIGSLYLVIGEVLEPDEPATDALLKSHQQLFTVRNAGLSQPYYCRHDHVHLLRGEVKPFLKTYYNQMTALQDRETYTFWEHYYHVSQHKTHEEGWFLMQTRWMLYLEQGGALHLLKAVPRRWLEDGRRIELRNVATYFGPLSFTATSRVKRGVIEAEVICASCRRPREVVIRLPHPDGRRPVRVEGGEYDAEMETVRIAPFTGKAGVRIRF
ncbi:hypothetical protein GX586_08500 [bacterium]|nr:hypothetical protein [bacterium]